MPGATRPSIHHIALTVTDLDASIAWYEKVFDITYHMEEGHKAGTGKVLADDAWQLMIVLHRHDTNGGEAFAETRTGLDHVGLAVPSRADLEAWQVHLEKWGWSDPPPLTSPAPNPPSPTGPMARC